MQSASRHSYAIQLRQNCKRERTIKITMTLWRVRCSIYCQRITCVIYFTHDAYRLLITRVIYLTYTHSLSYIIIRDSSIDWRLTARQLVWTRVFRSNQIISIIIVAVECRTAFHQQTIAKFAENSEAKSYSYQTQRHYIGDQLICKLKGFPAMSEWALKGPLLCTTHILFILQLRTLRGYENISTIFWFGSTSCVQTDKRQSIRHTTCLVYHHHVIPRVYM